jgi:alpha-tubulin suppressor-like RCC1 family protein
MCVDAAPGPDAGLDAAAADAIPPDAGSTEDTPREYLIASGNSHACVVRSGTVKCWGRSHRGQLGYGNSNSIGDDELPSSVGDVDVGGTVTRVVAGGTHTCAVLDTGDVRCWGSAAVGRLGYGNTNDVGDDELPSAAGNVDVGGTVVQLAAGSAHTCALLDKGKVRCWGGASQGKLGYGNANNIGDNEAPSSAGDVNVGGTVAQLAAGLSHTCALLDAGNVRCWGLGTSGQLGYGNTNTIGDDESPDVAGNVDLGGTAVQIATGSIHTCALLNTGHVRCWGNATNGRLGYGNPNNIGDDESPVTAGNVDVGGPAVQIAAGGNVTCALLETGDVRCWGEGASGQLGYGNTNDIGDDESPFSAGNVAVGEPVQELAVGSGMTCALLQTGNVRCWGDNFYGGLGYGHTDTIGDNETPASAGDVELD